MKEDSWHFAMKKVVSAVDSTFQLCHPKVWDKKLWDSSAQKFWYCMCCISHMYKGSWFAEVSVLQIHWDQAYCRSKVQFCFAKGLWSLAHRQLLFNCSFKWAVKALQFMRVSLLFLLFAETHLRSFLPLGTMTGWYIFLNTKHLVSERTK